MTSPSSIGGGARELRRGRGEIKFCFTKYLLCKSVSLNNKNVIAENVHDKFTPYVVTSSRTKKRISFNKTQVIVIKSCIHNVIQSAVASKILH